MMYFNPIFSLTIFSYFLCPTGPVAKPGGVATPPVCERGHFSFFGTSFSPAIDFSTEGQKRKRKRKEKKKGVELFFCHRV